MTELQKKAFDLYEKLLIERDEVSIKELALQIYGEDDRNNMTKTRQLINTMRFKGEWPENYTFTDGRGLYDKGAVNGKVDNNRINEELDEIDILKRVAELLSSLKLESMKKVLTSIKEQRF